jgi:hypothetical protein
MGKVLNQDRHMNKIISIGWTGSKRCYLNISREEAVERYKKSEGVLDPPDVDEFEFGDEFGAYDLWGPDKF